ncbi:MAG: PEP-utilizing enzyme [bacterium]|nr:PEP-utilizing enzyme [bacterium]
MKKYIFFNTEPNANILGLNPIINAFWDKRMEKLAGYRTSSFIYEIKDGIMNAGLLKKEWDKMVRIFFQRFLDDHSFPEKLKKILERDGRGLYLTSQEALVKHRSNLLSEQDKKKTLLRIFSLYTTVCLPGLVGPIIEFGSGGMAEKIREILKRKNLSALKLKTNECLTTLVYPDKITWTEKRRDALYKLAAGIYQRREKPANLSRPSLVEINGYVRKWGWSYYGYTGPEYSKQNALEEIKIILDKNSDPARQLKRIKNGHQDKIKEQKALARKLNLNFEEQYFIRAARDFSYTKAYRANLMSLACYTISKLLLDFVKKENYSLNQIGVCTVREVTAYLKEKRPLPPVSVLNKRRQYSLLISQEKNDRVLVGRMAASWVKNNVIREKVDKNLKELTGTVTCTGKVQKISGFTRVVVSSRDLHKVGNGDILISATTIPDYVPAMRRAGAIVTETGGLTCHAAIMSRELDKPCLVGVKHLLQVFKDGIRAEVDMEKGIIKKYGK